MSNKQQDRHLLKTAFKNEKEALAALSRYSTIKLKQESGGYFVCFVEMLDGTRRSYYLVRRNNKKLMAHTYHWTDKIAKYKGD